MGSNTLPGFVLARANDVDQAAASLAGLVAPNDNQAVVGKNGITITTVFPSSRIP